MTAAMHFPLPARIVWPDHSGGHPTIEVGEVHLWSASLSRFQFDLRHLSACLSPDEIAHQMKYRFDTDRHHYCISRALLRRLLGAYLDVPPASVLLQYGEHGKPYLCPQAHHPGVYFNVSHCDDLVVYGFTVASDQIGIDVERRRYLPDMADMASHFFSANEAAQLLTLEAEHRAAGFFNCWTRKEAFVKALGKGLSYGLDRFDVSLIPGMPARVDAIDGRTDLAAAWALRAFEPAPGYSGAMAILAPACRLRHWQLSPRPR